MPDPTNTIDVPIAGDVSATEAELASKIDEQLGIKGPSVETTEEESSEEDKDTSAPEESDSDKETEEDDPGVDEPEEVEPPKPTEPATPSDAELFIEVTDAEGVTHKISTIEDLPDDFVPKNNVETLRIVSELAKLDVKREQREAEAVTAAQTAAVKEIETQQYTSWDKEIAELVKEKRLIGNDTEKVDKVFGYMNEVNNARIKAGNPNLVSSFEDALEKFESKEAKDTETVAKKKENDLAKQKAGLIGNSSASGDGNYKPYRAGSARSIDDVMI